MTASASTVPSLLAAVRRGDPEALRELVRMVQPHLSRLARRHRGSLPEGLRPSDLVQDTLERVVRYLGQFQGESDRELRAWLGVILRNVLIQKRRSAQRLRRAVETVPLPDSDDLAAQELSLGPSQALRGQEEWRLLLRALYELPEHQREAIRRVLRGESVAETARAMGRTPAAVSCLLQRGGKQLQSLLGHKGPLGPWFALLRELLASAP